MAPASSGLSAELAAQAAKRVRLIEQPAGLETSSALREQAAATGATYVALGHQTSFARFAGDLVGGLAPKVNGIARTFAGAFARALVTQDPPAALAAWFVRNVAATPLTIAVDGLQRAADRQIARFIAEVVERTPNVAWIIAAQSLEELPLATWLTRGIAAPPIAGSTFEDGVETARALSTDGDVTRTAGEFEATGDVDAALRILLSHGREHEAVALIERHGFAFIESDRSYLLHDALAQLSEEARAESAVVLVLLAIEASLADRLDLSESFFKRALAVCTDQARRRHIEFMYGRDLLRRGRPEAIELLEGVAAAAALPVSLEIANRSALAAAYAVAGRDREAAALIELALRSARQFGDETLLARVLHQAAFVALRAARYPEAKEHALGALEIAERIGLHETTAGAASVLYNVALDVDEDLSVASAELRRIANCGAKCGNVDKQLYALVAAYEIEVERGGDAAIAALESDLKEFDVAFTERFTNEVLLPAQMVQLGWAGAFGRAHQILKASAGRQGDSGRRALRWAEIALYAAAARETTEALRAIRTAHAQLKGVSDSNVHAIRTAVYLALAQVLLGSPQSARTEIASLNGNVPTGNGRLRALVEFTRRLIAWHTGVTDHVELLSSLEHLRACEFGGFARLLEALPADLIEPAPADPRKARSA